MKETLKTKTGKYDYVFTDLRMTTEKRKKLLFTYGNMKRRIHKVKSYFGKHLCTPEEFYSWAQSNDDFHCLFDTGKCLSIDRIDSSKGYSIPNMQWLLMKEHRTKDRCSSKEHIDRMIEGQRARKKITNTKTGEIIYGIKPAADKIGMTYLTLWRQLTGVSPNKTNLILEEC